MDLNTQPKNAAKQTGNRPVPQATPAQVRAAEAAFRAEDKAMGAPLLATRKEKAVTNTPTPNRVIDAAIDASKAAHKEAWGNLEVVLGAALDVAYSENLPADYPGKERTVEVRRRHWMYMAAVSFATYNPVLSLDEEAVVEAVALAHDLMVERDMAIANQMAQPTVANRKAAQQLALDNRVRRMNGLPPTADAAPVAPVVSEREADVEGWTPALEAGVLKAMDTLRGQGTNFTDEHIRKNPRLKIAAAQYARKNPAAKNEWLGSVQSKMDVRPQFAAASLSDGQARGILNVWMSRRKSGR